ncbi:MAG TPA: 30S ribosome-binding factor RbfA [Dehalococcoidales bacterium]|nr:30S ribosome-binding factor RbfA [Dehalococcoidales bacterium]
MPQTHRMEKVNQLIRQELSNLLLRETKDPRLSGYISVNSVSTTPDLGHAKILVSCVCDEVRKKEILEALHNAAGFFRSEMGKVFKIRRVPELHFTWDNSIERGSGLLNYMDQVLNEDKSKTE